MALFTTAKTWKQSKCPSTNQWLKKIWHTDTNTHTHTHTHSGVLFSLQKEYNSVIYSNMNGPGNMRLTVDFS